MTDTLPILPTMGVGSYASPGWFIAARRLMRDGGLGSQDIEEMLEDATRIVVADQADAGIDIFTDGEFRRQRFVFEMYDRIDGIDRVPPARRLGVPGYDMAPTFLAVDTLSAPNGFGIVEDYLALRRLVPGSPTKIALPGPLTFAHAIDAGARDVSTVIEEIVDLVRSEVAALATAGADYIQLDEPSLPHPPYGLSLTDAAEIINRVLADIPARFAVHICFGNNAGRPFADRRFDRLVDAASRLACAQLVLEFANREMSEVEVLADLSERFDIAAGVIDVKNFYLETADDVARRLDQCLAHVAAEKLTVTADCGFSALPRYLARDKMRAMVAGAILVRGRL